MNSYTELNASERDAAFSLRPLTTGEVIDRTFGLFRRHFWLFTGIALGPALISLLSSICNLILRHSLQLPMQAGAFSNPELAISTVISSIMTIAIYGSSQAASTIAVSAVYLGRGATVKSSYEKSFGHWVRYPLLIMAQFVSAAWVTVAGYAVLLGVVLGTKKLGMAPNAPVLALIPYTHLPQFSVFGLSIYQGLASNSERGCRGPFDPSVAQTKQGSACGSQGPDLHGVSADGRLVHGLCCRA
jgi:hypothetical protein